jgi:hypothetical protein
MVSSSFFAACGWRAGLAAPGIAVISQIDGRPPAYPRHSSMIGVASPGAPAARDFVRRSRKFIGDFQWLRHLDGPRFQRDGIIARTHDKAINLTFHLHALKGDRSLKETAMRMKPCAPWGTGRRES